MQDPTDKRITDARELIEIWEMIKKSGNASNPYFLHKWNWALSGLGGGKYREKFKSQLVNSLTKSLLYQEIRARNLPAWPEVETSNAIILGFELGTNRPVVVSREILCRHALIVGSSGSGKTNLLLSLIQQLSDQGITFHFQDYKGTEGRRLLNIFS